jgi:hypothetical protein
MIIDSRKTYDCEPTLTDTQVLEFCKTGFIMLEGVVPDEINRRTFAFLDEYPSGEPTEIFSQDWFVDNVIRQPQAAGAVRSLLGKDFGLPILISNHRVQCPMPSQGWHHDGDSPFGHEVNYLQVFYYPQDVPIELGPTEILPGSHFTPTQREIDRGGLLTTAPAGTIFITIYSILHRRGKSTATAMRNLLKYNYWRLTPPKRDWRIEPDFDFHGADYGGHVHAKHVAQTFFWLCGKGHEFRTLGGQSWPYSGSRANQVDTSYGFPSDPPNW